MKRAKQAIPNFHLPETGHAGILINASNDVHEVNHDINVLHRDDHYLLIIIMEGYFKGLVDFKTFELSHKGVAIILPGQVHQVIKFVDAKAYTVSFDAILVASELVPCLQSYFYQQPTLPKDDVLYEQLFFLLQILIQQKNKQEQPLSNFVMHVTLQNMLALIAYKIQAEVNNDNTQKRSVLLARNFTTLLNDNYKQWKKPSDYAKALHMSVKHLNDTVKAVTGFSVSFHIQQQVMLEARRLLYHSNLSVKEIAYDIGFEDTVYFTRLFKKVTGVTPLAFRRQFSH